MAGKDVSNNPGTDNNEAVPVDEGQRSYIDNMFAGMGRGEAREEAQETEDRPVGEQLIEDRRREEVEDVDEVDEVDEVEEPIAEDDPQEDEDEIPQPADVSKEIADLKATIAALQQQLTKPAEEQTPAETETKIEIDPESFLTEEEIEDFAVDPGKVLRNLAARVYQKAREDTLRDLPDVVTRATQRQTAVTQAQQDFWSKNTDLWEKVQADSNLQTFVRITANQVQEENPNWTYGQIFEETGKRVRSTINLHAKAKNIESTAGKRTGQNRRPRGKRQAPAEDNRTEEQKLIDSMFDNAPARR